jgi:site-specific recombinase XerD
MSITDAIINYRRYLKRRNYSPHTVKNYMNILKHFVLWIDISLEEVCSKKILEYIEWQLDKNLSPKTINCHLNCIRCFYGYLSDEEGLYLQNPVKTGYCLRVPKPLPRHLKDEEVDMFLKAMEGRRDKAMFMLMLRCGLRVEELSCLTLDAIDLLRQRLHVKSGKGGKGRIVYMSRDAAEAFGNYLKSRHAKGVNKVFLVQKGRCRGKPISVRGIQKRVEYYARKTGIKVSCHTLRHTMATQLLNAEAGLSTIQDLLGHGSIITTQRYCKVSNLKVQRDYFTAIEKVATRQTEITVLEKGIEN